jgi:hypothetical protein
MPVVLFSDRAKAEQIRQRLARMGFEAELNEKPRLASLWFASKDAAGVRVEVQAEQFERAEKLLLEWDSTENILQGAIRCPECSSLRVDYPQYARNSLLTNLALGLVTKLHLLEKNYYCEDCHYSWPKEGLHPRRDRPHLAPFYFIEGVEQTSLGKSQPLSTPTQEHRKAA